MVGTLLGLAILLALTVILPVLSFVRASAARDRVKQLEQRLARLERVTSPPATTLTPAPVLMPGTATTPSPSPADAAATPSMDTTGGQSAHPRELPLRLEARIGTRWMLYVGVATLVIGIGLFIRYAFVNEWITEPLRVGIGGVIGGLLVLAGRRFAAEDHSRFGGTIAGGGIVTWYLAVYAAVNLYGLVSAPAGFFMLVAVTGVTAQQADRLRSQSLAMVAVVGGFATPYLVAVADTQLALFSYTALLVAAIVLLAQRHDWPRLNLTSFVLTGLTVLVWCARFYEPSAYLRTEAFFTLFAVMFLAVAYRTRGTTRVATRIAWMGLSTTPVWYHAASLAILGDHWLALLVYLIAITGIGVMLSVRWEAMWVRVALWLAVVTPLYSWVDGGPDGSWLVPAIVTWIAVACLHAFAQFELHRQRGAEVHAADVLLIPASGIGLFLGLHFILEPQRAVVAGLVAGGVGLGHGLVTAALRRMDPLAARHTLVVAFSLIVVAIAQQLDGAWGTILWSVEAAGLMWIGIGERRFWIRGVSGLLLVVTVARLVDLQQAPVPVTYDAFLNQRALLGLVIVGVLAIVAWLYGRVSLEQVPERHLARAAAIVAANIVLLATLSVEIHTFWELRRDVGRFAPSAEFFKQMLLTATWAAYATALTAVGIKRRYIPIRYLAIVVFAITVLKVFIVDFSQLDSVYRIVSSMALGLLLMGASYLYQRQNERLNPSAPHRPANEPTAPIETDREDPTSPTTPDFPGDEHPNDLT